MDRWIWIDVHCYLIFYLLFVCLFIVLFCFYFVAVIDKGSDDDCFSLN